MAKKAKRAVQPAQCAYGDDFAVVASSFRGLMTALAPAFHSVDHIAASICSIENAVGFSTALRSVNLCGMGNRRILGRFVKCKLSDVPITLET